MILNYNSVKGSSKQTALHATLDIHKPDIDILDMEFNVHLLIFHKNHAIFRNDCNVSGVFVFSATDRTMSN